MVAAAKAALDTWGFGMASVRFICGTQTQHAELEARLAEFLGQEATILYSSCFDANGGVFEVLLDEYDAVISDELNHASIIDGIRLCKAKRFRYKNRDMASLTEQLEAATGARRRLIVTDGVFSMDGYLAPLADICDLAEKYGAMVMVDDSHAVGFVGRDRRRHARTRRCAGPRRRHLRHARQGARWCVRRLHLRTRRDRRAAAATLASVPVLQRGRAVGRGRLTRRPGPRRDLRRRRARSCARTPSCSGGG